MANTTQHDGTKNKSYAKGLEVPPTENLDNQNNNKVIDSDDNLEKDQNEVKDLELKPDSESEKEEKKDNIDESEDHTDIDEKIRVLMERKQKRDGKIGESEQKIINPNVDMNVQNGIAKIKKRVLADTVEDSSSCHQMRMI